MKVFYRISDAGNQKDKPNYVHDKKKMFSHFIKRFKNNDVYVFADNVSEDMYCFLKTTHNPFKVFRTSLGNAGSFMHTVDFALKYFQDSDKIYFAEDDYIYVEKAPQIIEQGLEIAEYSSGYDHPDKYINFKEGGPNPFIEKGGEATRVMITEGSHWKLTNSCCMTFATTVRTLRQDYDVFKTACLDKHPDDFAIFRNLIQSKNRTLVSCIPAVSTHGETQWLAKFVDWEKAMQD